MSLLQNSNAISAGGYDINNSLRFRQSATAYLSRTFTTPTNNKIGTISLWRKRGSPGTYDTIYGTVSTTTGNGPYIQFNTDSLRFVDNSSDLTSSQVFRDYSAWYHIVVAIDTTQATASNRVKIYVNGSQITAFSSATYGALNYNSDILSSGSQYIGYSQPSNARGAEGYLAEVNFIDGQALTPSSFGETDAVTGLWVAKKYTGTYGTNGFYLKFSDIATTSGSNAGLGKDFSGNSNYWTTNNISVTAGITYDAMTDSPTLTSATVANYAVMNPLQKQSGVTLSNGNLNVQTTGSSGSGTVNATFGVSSGKWYWETILNAATDATIFGIDEITELPGYPGSTSTSYSYYPVSALKINNAVQTSYGVTATTNDIIGCALDMDNGKIWWSKNGTWMASGDPVAGTNAAFTGITGTKTPAVGDGSSTSNVNVEYNFGQRPFAYTPPTGYKALNTFNLPDSTIKKGNKYMDATLYTGNGSTLAVTNAGAFKPDLVWIKGRNAVSNHNLQDSVRGATKQLSSSDISTSETTTTDALTSFNTNGFSLGANTTGFAVNNNGATFVGWQWQAGQGTTSSNTSGSITSTVSVNASAGFSIVTYTGVAGNVAKSFGHGLGVAPSMVIVKDRDTSVTGTSYWTTWQTALGLNGYLHLNATDAKQTNANRWGNALPTSTVVSVGGDASNVSNESGHRYVAYCWAEIAGFSKFGSYTGNGSTDGPFVFTNFLPRYIMVKRTDVSGQNWEIIDSARNTYNVMGYEIFANTSGAEDQTAGNNDFDFLSNGFKLRNTWATINANGGTYIYACFASNPFKNSLAR